MRIWDLNPGYLNRQSLLGEHRELHGIVSILVNKKKGYAKHPETIRWQGYGWALKQRHRLLAGEMALRGYSDKSPVLTQSGKDQWPTVFIDEPFRQFEILKDKYQDKEKGRIPIPKNSHQLWSQHKYSVLARDVSLYKRIGQEISKKESEIDFTRLAVILVESLRKSPSIGGLRNALQHMWGYVSQTEGFKNNNVESWSLKRLNKEVQHRSLAVMEPYLVESTALGELGIWLT